MELTGKLKEQVENAKTKEEKKRLIEDAGMELTDEDMEKVAGGGYSISEEDSEKIKEYKELSIKYAPKNL